MSKAIQAGEAYVRLSVRGAKDMERRLARAQRALGNFARDAMKIGTAAGALGAGLGMALKPAIDSAAKWENAIFRANAVFKGSASDVVKFADDMGAAYGRSRRGILDFTTTSSLMFKNLGVEQGQALKMGQELARRSILFANLSGISAEDMQIRFVRALSGSAEVLDQFGVNLKENALKLEQLRMGVPVSEFNEYTKIIARFNLLLKDTNVAMDAGAPGTYIDAAQSLAANFERLKEVLGETLRRDLVVIFQGIAAAFKELSTRKQLLSEIALGAIGLIAALAASSVAFIALGVVLKVVVKLIPLLLGSIKAFTAVSSLAGSAIWATGRGIGWGFTKLASALPLVQKGMRGVARDVALIERMQIKKIPILMEASGVRPSAGFYRSSKFDRAVALYTGQGGPGLGGASRRFQRTGFGTMASGVTRTGATMQVVNQRVRQAGNAARTKIAGGFNAASKAARGLSVVTGKLISKVSGIGTAIALVSESFQFLKTTAAGTWQELGNAIKDVLPLLMAIPDVLQIYTRNQQTGKELFQDQLDMIVKRFEIAFKKIQNIMTDAFEQAIANLINMLVFALPIILDELPKVLAGTVLPENVIENIATALGPKLGPSEEEKQVVRDMLSGLAGRADVTGDKEQLDKMVEEFDKKLKTEIETIKQIDFASGWKRGILAGPPTGRGMAALMKNSALLESITGPMKIKSDSGGKAWDEKIARMVQQRKSWRGFIEATRPGPIPKGGSRAFGGLSTQDVANQMKADGNYHKQVLEWQKEEAEKSKKRNDILESFQKGGLLWSR